MSPSLHLKLGTMWNWWSWPLVDTSHCGLSFKFAFPGWWVMLSIFHISVFICILWKNPYLVLLSIFLNWVICFHTIEIYESLIHFGYEPLVRYIVCKYLISFCTLHICCCWLFPLLLKSFLFWYNPYCTFLLLLCFCYDIQEIIANVLKAFPHVFFYDIYGFRSNV